MKVLPCKDAAVKAEAPKLVTVTGAQLMAGEAPEGVYCSVRGDGRRTLYHTWRYILTTMGGSSTRLPRHALMFYAQGSGRFTPGEPPTNSLYARTDEQVCIGLVKP